jgi:type IV pilus assembly protein PilV
MKYSVKTTKPIFAKNQQGATLIEALVSILLFSLGLLGIAGLQANALAFQKSSWATHRIAELTAEIGERMRANPDGVEIGSYVYMANYATARTATINSNNCRTTAGSACAAPQIANDDLAAWLRKAQNSLPQGAVRLEGAANVGYTATVMYLDKSFLTVANAPDSSTTCTAATVGFAWSTCCPAAAAVPAGVKCSRSFIQPFIPE